MIGCLCVVHTGKGVLFMYTFSHKNTHTHTNITIGVALVFRDVGDSERRKLRCGYVNDHTSYT